MDIVMVVLLVVAGVTAVEGVLAVRRARQMREIEAMWREAANLRREAYLKLQRASSRDYRSA